MHTLVKHFISRWPTSLLPSTLRRLAIDDRDHVLFALSMLAVTLLLTGCGNTEYTDVLPGAPTDPNIKSVLVSVSPLKAPGFPNNSITSIVMQQFGNASKSISGVVTPDPVTNSIGVTFDITTEDAGGWAPGTKVIFIISASFTLQGPVYAAYYVSDAYAEYFSNNIETPPRLSLTSFQKSNLTYFGGTTWLGQLFSYNVEPDNLATIYADNNSGVPVTYSNLAIYTGANSGYFTPSQFISGMETSGTPVMLLVPSSGTFPVGMTPLANLTASSSSAYYDGMTITINSDAEAFASLGQQYIISNDMLVPTVLAFHVSNGYRPTSYKESFSARKKPLDICGKSDGD
jgi:hypothetical protein